MRHRRLLRFLLLRQVVTGIKKEGKDAEVYLGFSFPYFVIRFYNGVSSSSIPVICTGVFGRLAPPARAAISFSVSS